LPHEKLTAKSSSVTGVHEQKHQVEVNAFEAYQGNNKVHSDEEKKFYKEKTGGLFPEQHKKLTQPAVKASEERLDCVLSLSVLI
jgi:hypothetical protein